jgi:hypothetical protein
VNEVVFRILEPWGLGEEIGVSATEAPQLPEQQIFNLVCRRGRRQGQGREIAVVMPAGETGGQKGFSGLIGTRHKDPTILGDRIRCLFLLGGQLPLEDIPDIPHGVKGVLRVLGSHHRRERLG